MPNTWIEIDQEALRKNAEGVRSLLKPNTRLMAVVKANAYGHGIEQTVPALDENVDWFGVDNFAEAERVRGLSQKPILILNPLEYDKAEKIVSSKIEQAVSSMEDIEALAEVSDKDPARIHIKIDTGMSRQGFSLKDAPEAIRRASGMDGVVISGVMTHFACADISKAPATKEQIEAFEEVLGELGLEDSVIRHASNSSATVLNPEANYDLVRCGIILFGIYPSRAVEEGSSVELRPALKLKSRVALIKDVPRGHGIGYGLHDALDSESKVALIPIGYSDGYSRKFSEKASVLIRGMRARVRGNISMNLLSVDVTNIKDVALSDEVTLIGKDSDEEITVLEGAEIEGTIVYELISNLSRALPRILV